MAAISTYNDLRAHLETVLGGFAVSGASLHWPDQDDDPPEPSSDPASPSGVVLIEYQIDAAELSTFDGSAELRGRLVCLVWVDRRAGDGRVLTIVEALRTLVLAGDTSDAQSSVAFLEPRLGPSVRAGDQEAFYGRELHCPFVWMRGVA